MNYYVDGNLTSFDDLPKDVQDFWRNTSPGVRTMQLTYLNKRTITYERRYK